MFRLLIVDDERHVADALETAFLTQTEIDLEVYKAYLAKDALRIFGRLKIDVLLSDIKMPGIDGFGLADRVRANWPDVRIIFLTAHNDFELLYRTKKYKDISFLLKTEDESTVIGAVQKAIADIEDARRVRRLESSEGDMRGLVMQRVRNDALLNMLREDVPGAGGPGECEIAVRADRMTALVCCVEADAPRGVERERRFMRLSALFSSLFADRAACETVMTEDGVTAALVQSGAEGDDERLRRFVGQMFDVVSESALSETRGAASLFLCDELLRWRQIAPKIESIKAYAAENAAVNARGGGRVFTEADERYLKRENDLTQWKSRFSDNVKAIQRGMESADFQGALDALAPIREAAAGVKSKHHYPLIILYQMIANALLEYVFAHDLIETLSFSGGIYRLFTIDDFDSWGAAFDYLKSVVRHVARISADMEKDSIQRFVTYIQEYVRNHLSEELSLTVLSEKMNYNPSYISRLFKQASGRNLMEYIGAIRMERAANALVTTNQSIQEIAREVGMASAQYFATAFRRKYGKSPQEYRRAP